MSKQRLELILTAALLATSTHFIFPALAWGQVEEGLGKIPPEKVQQSRNPALQTWEGDLSGQDSYKPGFFAQIEAVPNPGFAFERWEGGPVHNPEEAKTFVDMEDHRKIKPIWNRIWNVIAQPDRKEAGKVEGGGAYPDGAEVTLSVEPNEGFTFLGWEGRGIRPEEKEELTTTILADGDHDIVARFQNDNQDQQDNRNDQQDQQDQDQNDQQDQEDQEDPNESEPEEQPQEPEEQDEEDEPQPEEENEGNEPPPEEAQVPPEEPQPMEMTLDEALRLLEAMEDDEKKLPLFIVQPPDPRADPKKDW